MISGSRKYFVYHSWFKKSWIRNLISRHKSPYHQICYHPMLGFLPACLAQRIIDDPLDLAVGTAKFVGSPLLYLLEGIGVQP